MKNKIENGILTIYLEGKIYTDNAEAVAAEIDAIRGSVPHESLVLDAEELQAISSAGLRTVLRTKKAEPSTKVINTSSSIYEIFEMTGFTEMMEIHKGYKRMSIDGCKIIGQGAKGTVYRVTDDMIVKAYHDPDCLPDIQRERDLARRAFVLGIPTAISYDIVKIGDSYGSVFELLDAKQFSELIVEDEANRDKYITEFALLLKKIHETIVRKTDMPCVKIIPTRWMETSSKFLPAENAEKITRLIEAVPDPPQMLHCDYHTNNVMMQNDEAILIDMDTLSYGHPIFELANVYFTYAGFQQVEPEVNAKFLGMTPELAQYVWDKFIAAYLGTEDEARITEVTNKARLLCYVRIMRHVGRRNPADSPVVISTMAYCNEKINEIIDSIDTLEF